MQLDEIRNLITTNSLHKFYASTEWRRLRKAALKRDNYECKRCKNNGKYSKARCVHHINEIQDCPELALALNNLMSLCFNCHNVVHERILKPSEQEKKRIFIEERWE